jgi:putative transcription factor
MICEMCGSDVPRTKFVKVEGAALHVCSRCERYAASEAAKTESGKIIMPSVAERLVTRQKRQREKDVFSSGEEKELALDYPDRIKDARRKRGLSQDELAKQINEKKSVIVKAETGDIRPSDKLVRKFERALGISLRESIQTEAAGSRSAYSQGMTLGDFVKYED